MIYFTLTKHKKFILPILIFIFIFLIYFASSGGRTDISDGKRAFLYTENLALNGKLGYSLDLPSAMDNSFFQFRLPMTEILGMAANSSFKKNHMNINDTQMILLNDEYVKKTEFVNWFKNQNKDEFYDQVPLVLPTLGAPLYHVALVFDQNPIRFVPLFLNPIIIAGLCVVIFLFGKELFNSEKIGFVLSLIFGLTSFIWPYVSTYYSRPLAILFLMIGIYLIILQRKNHGTKLSIFSGICLGLSFSAQPHLLVTSPALAIFGIYQFRNNKKQIMGFLLAFIILTGFMFYLNYYRYGSVDDFGFPGKPFETKNPVLKPAKSFEGLYGLLISPGKAVFPYFPLVLLFPLGFYYLFKQEKTLALLFAYITIVFYLIAGTSEIWDKVGSFWGPHRYILPILPLITISLGAIIRRFSGSKKITLVFVVLSILGFMVNLLGNLFHPRLGFLYGFYVEKLGQLPEGDLRSIFAWDPFNSYISQNLKILFTDYHHSRIGECYDLYLYCEFGLVPIIFIAVIITIIGFTILTLLGIFNFKIGLKKI